MEADAITKWERLVKLLFAALAFTFLVFLSTAWVWAGEIADQEKRIRKLESYRDQDIALNRDIVEILDALNKRMEEIDNAKRTTR